MRLPSQQDLDIIISMKKINTTNLVPHYVYVSGQGWLKDTDDIMFTLDILDAKLFWKADEAFKMKKMLHKFYETVAIMRIID